VFHTTLDDDCKGTTLSLSGRRIGDRRAAFLGLPHRLLYVIDLEVGPNDRLLMSGQGLPDSHESSVSSSRNTCLPEIGVWGTKGETVQALVERSQGVYIVADDLQIVKLNGHLQLPSFGTPQPCVLIEPVLPALDMRPEWLGEPLFSNRDPGLTSFSLDLVALGY
jgi:hypothetical protein